MPFTIHRLGLKYIQTFEIDFHLKAKRKIDRNLNTFNMFGLYYIWSVYNTVLACFKTGFWVTRWFLNMSLQQMAMSCYK